MLTGFYAIALESLNKEITLGATLIHAGYISFQGSIQDFAQGGARFRARSARDFFRPPLSNFRPPLSASQGGAKIAQGGGGLIITNRHNTVMKSFKFGRKGLGVLDSFFFKHVSVEGR